MSHGHIQGFGGYKMVNQAALLQQQIANHQQARSIYSYQHQPSFQSNIGGPVNTLHQMSYMMNMMFAMMQSMTQLNQGYSSFLGGGFGR